MLDAKFTFVGATVTAALVEYMVTDWVGYMFGHMSFDVNRVVLIAAVERASVFTADVICLFAAITCCISKVVFVTIVGVVVIIVKVKV